MKQEIQRDITVTSRGQLTLPVGIRRAMKLGSKRKVRLTMNKAGEVSIRPLPDVMSFFGSLKGGAPYDPKENQKGREAMGKKGLETD